MTYTVPIDSDISKQNLCLLTRCGSARARRAAVAAPRVQNGDPEPIAESEASRSLGRGGLGRADGGSGSAGSGCV